MIKLFYMEKNNFIIINFCVFKRQNIVNFIIYHFVLLIYLFSYILDLVSKMSMKVQSPIH
jgi:hypothetical protein